jgi:hypothetical protein
MNSTKLMTHPSDPNKFIIESDFGNLEVSNTEVRKTTLNGVGDPLPWDITISGMLDNAKIASLHRISAEAIEMLQIAAQDKIEDFDA